MSFEIIPVEGVPEDKPKRKPVRKHRGGKELNNSKLWEYGWLMWKMGTLFRFRIVGTTDMKTPILPPHKYTKIKRRRGGLR